MNGTKNGRDELNRISAIYGTRSYAESARSINENDIIKLTNITENDKKGGNNAYYEYGAKYTYMYDETNSSVMYKKNDGDYTSLKRESLLFPDGTEINSENKRPKEITASHYAIKFTDSTNSNIVVDSEGYWVASNAFVVTDGEYSNMFGDFVAGDFNYGFRIIENVEGYDMGTVVSFSSPSGGIEKTSGYKVRPVVILNANTQLQADGKDENGTSKYKIV